MSEWISSVFFSEINGLFMFSACDYVFHLFSKKSWNNGNPYLNGLLCKCKWKYFPRWYALWSVWVSVWGRHLCDVSLQTQLCLLRWCPKIDQERENFLNPTSHTHQRSDKEHQDIWQTAYAPLFHSIRTVFPSGHSSSYLWMSHPHKQLHCYIQNH